jgi:hypothetical protein
LRLEARTGDDQVDPNITLTRIRELQTQLIHGSNDMDTLANMGMELAELIKALDEWMVKGGFFPRDWRPF